MATPPASYGYPKATITADKLPIWQQPLARFSVQGANDWKVSSLASIDRGIRVEVGVGSGDAVTDQTFEYETMSLPSPDVAARWYLIVRRRNWSGTGTSTLVAIASTTAATPVLPTRFNTPGERSDQPLAMVRVTQKDTTVQQVIDLRCWASNGGVEVADKLALSYLDTPGAAVKLGPSTWRYERKSNGVWGWQEYKPADQTAPLFRDGYKVVRTNPDGYCTVPYDEPFPGGTRIAVPVGMNPPAGMSLVRFVSGEKAAANFLVTATNGEPLRNVSVAIGYIATGF